jgi:hypothetical protein
MPSESGSRPDRYWGAIEPNASAVVAGDDAEAIVFDLVQPHLAGGQCLSFGAHKDGERVRLYSRPGNDLTKRLD